MTIARNRYISLTIIITTLLILIELFDCHLHTHLYKVVPPVNLHPQLKNVSTKQTHKNVSEILLVDSLLTGTKGFGYYMTVNIGSPPQKMNLIIDTGSSNTAVSASLSNKNSFKYNQSTSLINYNIPVQITYDSGKWSGYVVQDVISFDSIYYKYAELKSQNESHTFRASFDLITKSENFFPLSTTWNGILGLAYDVLTMPATLVDKSTVLDNFIKAFKVEDKFSIALCGIPNKKFSNDVNGHFIIGGVNESLYEGNFVDIPVVRRWFYEVLISSISVENKPIIVSSCKMFNDEKTIIDSGTAMTLLPGAVFDSLIFHIKQQTKPHPYLKPDSPFWAGMSVLCVDDPNSFYISDYFPEVYFNLVINDTASVQLALSPQNYVTVTTRGEQTFESLVYCFRLGFAKSKTGTVLGNTFMEGFYFLFNKKNSTIGIAQSKCNTFQKRGKKSRIIKIETNKRGLMSCKVAIKNTFTYYDYLTTYFNIILCIIFGGVLLPIIISMLCMELHQRRKNSESIYRPGSDYQSFN